MEKRPEEHVELYDTVKRIGMFASGIFSKTKRIHIIQKFIGNMTFP